jgi:Ni2+-binding GTPase involved in maturation of urease and hydrogenase
VRWGIGESLGLLVTESAGLCNRCSPHIKGVLAICVIDNLSGVNTPSKIGPMLRYADIVAVTKGDIVSQAEREVFAHNVRKANPRAEVIFVNGITGQGAFMLSRRFLAAPEVATLEGSRLRFTMPAALCSYCLGQTKIGEEYQMGATRKIDYARGVSHGAV